MLAGVLALLGVALGVLVLWVDPNDYREPVSRLVREHAGVELKLAGELGWRFYPVLGFRAQQVGLALRADAPPLMQVEALTVGVKLLPLLTKNIEVDALEIRGLRAHLVRDARGNNNWQPPAMPAGEIGGAAAVPSPASATAAPASTAGTLPRIRIPEITVRDAQIRYEDQKAAQDYRVEVPLLAFTEVTLEAKKFAAADLALEAVLTGLLARPLSLTLRATAHFDQPADVVELKLNRVQVANLQARGQVRAERISAAPQFRGKLQTDAFDLKQLLQTLGMDPPQTRDSAALTHVQADLTFSGTPQQIAIAPLQGQLDDSTLTGEIALTDLATQAVRFDLKLDRLDVDRYLPPASATAKKAASAAPATSSAPAKPEWIPVQALRDLNLAGRFRADELVVKKIPVRTLGLRVQARSGDVQVNDLAAQLLQGSLAGRIGLDVRGAQPRIVTRIDLDNLQLQELLAPFVPLAVLSGRSSLAVDTRTQGNDADTLLRQALGQLNLRVADGVLHGVNLNQLVVAALKQKMGDFTVLMPDYETRLPKALKGDMAIRQLLANMTVENGHLITPGLNAQTDAGQFRASGDIDLVAQAFDYRFGVVLSSLDDHRYLKGAEWPVRCKGSASIPVQDWCRPDLNGMGLVLQKAAGIALREKATEKLGEKLGVPGASAAEVKQKAQQKAQEKVNEQVGKQLDKWLKRSRKKEAAAPAAVDQPAAEPVLAEPAPTESSTTASPAP